MAAESTSPSARITVALENLTQSAKKINDVSDELFKHVHSLERALGRLNVGVACWTEMYEHTSDGVHFWREYVGYAEVAGEWRIAIQTSEGSDNHPEDSDDKIWPFNEAPRHLRVKAIDKLPDLFEALVKTCDATTERLLKKVQPAQELAVAVNAFLSQKKK